MEFVRFPGEIIMVNKQVLARKWNEVRGRLQEKWGDLTDDDVRSFNGNVDQLVGKIQQKTGDTREAIEEFLGEVAEHGSNVATEIRDEIEENAGDLAGHARAGYDAIRQGYADAERVIQERPGQSLAIAFGLGLVAGVGLSLVLRDRHQDRMSSRGRHAAENFRRQMVDALSGILPEGLKHRG
jgi:uncharacterized protein YjbJ (UPF0337 family)